MPELDTKIRSQFDRVTDLYASVPFMDEKRARVLRDLIATHDCRDILEIGFYQGKSSSYIAAILEDRGGKGRLTTIDRSGAAERSPNIHALLDGLDLAHRVAPIFAFRSFTWELQKLIGQEPRPQFDLCYFDGGHTWDETGFGVLLVDFLLRPGGILLLDDMNWTVRTSAYYRQNPKRAARFSKDEAATPAVRRTWDLILPHLGYELLDDIKDLSWGVARKTR